MLERPDLVRSPIALSKVVELLQAMLSPQLDPRRRALGGAVPQPSLIATAELSRNAAHCCINAGRQQTWRAVACSMLACRMVSGTLCARSVCGPAGHEAASAECRASKGCAGLSTQSKTPTCAWECWDLAPWMVRIGEGAGHALGEKACGA